MNLRALERVHLRSNHHMAPRNHCSMPQCWTYRAGALFDTNVGALTSFLQDCLLFSDAFLWVSLPNVTLWNSMRSVAFLNSICDPTCRKLDKTYRTRITENQKNYSSVYEGPLNLWGPVQSNSLNTAALVYQQNGTGCRRKHHGNATGRYRTPQSKLQHAKRGVFLLRHSVQHS